MFDVIPAIDVSRGRLASYAAEGPRPVERFGGDPLAAARSFIDAGALRLHVVDMDLAFEGEARNLDVLAAIAESGIPVQAAGGARTSSDVRSFLDAGSAGVVLASAALDDPVAVTALLAAHGPRLVIGIEVADGRIRSRGRHAVDLDLMETLGWLVPAGAAMFLVTSIERVDGLGGPDVGLVARVVRAGPPVLAAGGVATLDDLRSLRAAGAKGAVVGRAALDGSLELKAAIAEMA